MGWRAHIHAGVVQDEILQGHELALEPEARAGVLEMCPADPPVTYFARSQALVQPCQGILGGGKRKRHVSTTLRQPVFEFKLGFPAFGLAG
jgi:hypothetical protein